MSFSTKTTIFILFLITVGLGYNYFRRPFLRQFEAFQEEIQQKPASPSEPEVSGVLERLSPQERIWDLMAVPITLEANQAEASAAAEIAFLGEVNPGFVLVFGKQLDFEVVRNFTQSLPVSPHGYSPLVATDHEGGTVQRLSGEGFTELPDWQDACELTVGTRKDLFAESARELRYAGVNIVLGPVVDIGKSGSFLKKRACGDSQKAIKTADDFVEVFAHQGILSVIKHFPGIGSVQNDIHFSPATVAIKSEDTAPFQTLLSKYPNIAVMTTHVIVAERTNGIPCSLSAVCLDAFPKNFPLVLLFTDALEMKSAIVPNEDGSSQTLEETAFQALMAGNTVLVFGEDVPQQKLKDVVSFLTQKYEENEDFRQKVDANNEKILKLRVPQKIEASGEKQL